jgi:hypothetical protein
MRSYSGFFKNWRSICAGLHLGSGHSLEPAGISIFTSCRWGSTALKGLWNPQGLFKIHFYPAIASCQNFEAVHYNQKY